MRAIASILVTIAAMAGVPVTAQSVKTEFGTVRGATQDGVSNFKGIPFAAAPTGDRRWREPQFPEKWTGERPATAFGANCPQMAVSPAMGGTAGTMSEDCLFLNIWRPAAARAGQKLPVMIWIHGGAFVFGSGAAADFSGTRFARQNVVLVTLNYRLGRLGFFAFPALARDHPDELKGNYGYMDQIAALRWVERNIGAFGGDPRNITVFGESAGGVSVHTLLTSPLSRDLFQKAIIESGGGRDGVLTGRSISEDRPDAPSAETIGVNFARRHGIEGSGEDALAKLRAISFEQIVDGGLERDGNDGPIIYSGPILDGRLMVETPEAAYKGRRQMRVPLMIGSNSADFVGFLSATTRDGLFAQFGSRKLEARQAYDPAGTTDLRTLLVMAGSDKVQAEPARFTADAFSRNGSPVYRYRFSYVAGSKKAEWSNGAPHGTEIPFVFDTIDARFGAAVTANDRDVARKLNSYWANFAKTGNPNGSALTRWSRHDPNKNHLLNVRPDGSMLDGPDPLAQRLDLSRHAVETARPGAAITE